MPARSASAGSNTLFLERKLFNELFQIIDTYRSCERNRSDPVGDHSVVTVICLNNPHSPFTYFLRLLPFRTLCSRRLLRNLLAMTKGRFQVLFYLTTNHWLVDCLTEPFTIHHSQFTNHYSQFTVHHPPFPNPN